MNLLIRPPWSDRRRLSASLGGLCGFLAADESLIRLSIDLEAASVDWQLPFPIRSVVSRATTTLLAQHAGDRLAASLQHRVSSHGRSAFDHNVTHEALTELLASNSTDHRLVGVLTLQCAGQLMGWAPPWNAYSWSPGPMAMLMSDTPPTPFERPPNSHPRWFSSQHFSPALIRSCSSPAAQHLSADRSVLWSRPVTKTVCCESSGSSLLMTNSQHAAPPHVAVKRTSTPRCDPG